MTEQEKNKTIQGLTSDEVKEAQRKVWKKSVNN